MLRPLLLLLALGELAVRMGRGQATFLPQVDPVETNAVWLEIHAGNKLQTLAATVNGVPCTLLFDTGAALTTFDRAFISRAFPEMPLTPITFNGKSNVRQPPELFPIESLQVGKAQLRDFMGVALPLEHLSQAVGTQIDGILGLNAMAYAPFRLSLKHATVIWAPEDAQPPTGVPLPILPANQPWDLLMAIPELKKPDGTTIRPPLLIDSGSTFTFLPEALWPASDEQMDLSATDVNATAQVQFKRGQRATMCLEGPRELTFTPLLTRQAHVQIGADFLMEHDLWVDVKTRRVRVEVP